MWQIISCNLICLLIIAFRNFQRFSVPIAASLDLEITLDCKMKLPKRKKTTTAIDISLQSVQQRHYVFQKRVNKNEM